MEKWKDIKEYENSYQISNFGRVKSLKRRGNWEEKILKPYLNDSGYDAIKLFKDGKGKTFKVHKLVCEHFVDNKLNKPCVNHKDGVKTNNHYLNLGWVTKSENTQHAWDNGLMESQDGEASHYAKLTEKEVLEIRRLRKLFKLRELGKMYNVRLSTISMICTRKTWKHLEVVA